MASRYLSLAGLLATVLVGCQRQGTPARSTSASSPPADPPAARLILSPSALRDAFLIGERASIRWRFVGDQFVVESWNEPLPESLQSDLVEVVGNVYRIAGHWRLLDEGRELRVSQLQADGPPGKSEASLVVEAAPHDLLRVNGAAYRLMDHPYEREVLPNEVFNARLSSVEAAHLVHVDREGKPESLRLAGLVGPPADHPLGPRARARIEELLRGKRFHVRVYDPPGDKPRRAHLYTAGFLWINLTLIDEGLAWHDKPNDHEWLFATHEDGARRNGVGIWSLPDTAPPWWIPNLTRP